MWVQIISSIFCSHFLCIYTQKWNCSSKVVLFLIFLRKSVLFTIVVAPICIPATGAQGFSFLWILSNTSYLWSFWYSHSDRCEMIYHHGLHLHFPDDQWVGGSFYVSFGHLCIFGKCLLSPSAHFFFFFFFCHGAEWDIYVFRILTPYQIYDLKIVPVYGCLFIFLVVFFAVQKLFSLILSHLLIFAFVTFAFGVKKKKNHRQDPCWGAYPNMCFLLGVLQFQALNLNL